MATACELRRSDNDNDGIEDGSEIQQGSDMNLVTPVISALQPPSGTALGPTIVTVQGTNFLPGLSVQFGAQNPTPSNLTPTSFDVTLQPTTPGGVLPLVVTLPNGETRLRRIREPAEQAPRRLDPVGHAAQLRLERLAFRDRRRPAVRHRRRHRPDLRLPGRRADRRGPRWRRADRGPALPDHERKRMHGGGVGGSRRRRQPHR